MDRNGHCERFNELPEETKLFLEHLTSEKIQRLEKTIRLSAQVETMGKFWKWTFIFVFTAFTGAMAVGQALEWFWTRIKGES